MLPLGAQTRRLTAAAHGERDHGLCRKIFRGESEPQESSPAWLSSMKTNLFGLVIFGASARPKFMLKQGRDTRHSNQSRLQLEEESDLPQDLALIRFQTACQSV